MQSRSKFNKRTPSALNIVRHKIRCPFDHKLNLLYFQIEQVLNDKSAKKSASGRKEQRSCHIQASWYKKK